MNGEDIAYKLGFGARRREEVTAQFRQRHAAAGPPPPTVKVPLNTGQHILHLLITVFTGGVWAPVWICLAIRGNQVPVAPAPPSWAQQPYPQQWQQQPPGWQPLGPPPGR